VPSGAAATLGGCQELLCPASVMSLAADPEDGGEGRPRPAPEHRLPCTGAESAPGRWSPAFRAWLVAYMRGDEDEATLAALDEAAQDAADKARAILVHRDRCPTCGRPYIEPEELLAAVEAADRRSQE
jgi:hypothetical protein